MMLQKVFNALIKNCKLTKCQNICEIIRLDLKLLIQHSRKKGEENMAKEKRF